MRRLPDNSRGISHRRGNFPAAIVGLSIHNMGSTSRLSLDSTTAATWNLDDSSPRSVNLIVTFDRTGDARAGNDN